MKPYLYSPRGVPIHPVQTARHADVSFWFVKAVSLLLLTVAMLALMALTGCKDAGKAGASGSASAAGGMSAPPPGNAASAPKP